MESALSATACGTFRRDPRFPKTTIGDFRKMTAKIITLEDVARTAKCSLATVSRAINGAPQVSDGVRAKVRDAIRQTGYKPHRRRMPAANAKNTRTNDGGTAGLPGITVVVYRHEAYELILPQAHGVKVSAPHEYHAPDLQSQRFIQSNNFIQGMIEGMLAACSYFQVKAEIISTDNLRDPKLLEEVGGTKRGGLIVSGVCPDDEWEGFLARCRQPVVLLDILHRGGQSVVTSDNIDGMRQSVGYLAGLGHRDIGFIGRPGNSSYRERYSGFVAAMAEAGLEVRREWIWGTPGGGAGDGGLGGPALSR
ncbi:MAG: LacI family transcriptional regulator [Kiritimatiellaeota bacterium]|nr:LacI family transcriptional regulator [Kiritimatiellota bacterium]